MCPLFAYFSADAETHFSCSVHGPFPALLYYPKLDEQSEDNKTRMVVQAIIEDMQSLIVIMQNRN